MNAFKMLRISACALAVAAVISFASNNQAQAQIGVHANHYGGGVHVGGLGIHWGNGLYQHGGWGGYGWNNNWHGHGHWGHRYHSFRPHYYNHGWGHGHGHRHRGHWHH